MWVYLTRVGLQGEEEGEGVMGVYDTRSGDAIREMSAVLFLKVEFRKCGRGRAMTQGEQRGIRDMMIYDGLYEAEHPMCYSCNSLCSRPFTH